MSSSALATSLASGSGSFLSASPAASVRVHHAASPKSSPVTTSLLARQPTLEWRHVPLALGPGQNAALARQAPQTYRAIGVRGDGHATIVNEGNTTHRGNGS